MFQNQVLPQISHCTRIRILKTIHFRNSSSWCFWSFYLEKKAKTCSPLTMENHLRKTKQRKKTTGATPKRTTRLDWTSRRVNSNRRTVHKSSDASKNVASFFHESSVWSEETKSRLLKIVQENLSCLGMESHQFGILNRKYLRSLFTLNKNRPAHECTTKMPTIAGGK